MSYDRAYWEQLWAKTLREHQDKVAQRPPNAHLITEVANVRPGRALDAGCGHGAETLWLAAHGWEADGRREPSTSLRRERGCALDPSEWELPVAEERPRAIAGTGVDAVILARRVGPKASP